MMPYTTLDEAEHALGRSLTHAETLWFNYTFNKSCFHIYCHSILIVFLVFSIAPLPSVFLELTRIKCFEKFKIQSKVKLSPWQVWKCFKDGLMQFFYLLVPIQILSYPPIQKMGFRMGLPLPSGLEIMMQIIVYSLIEDYTHYWLHRLLHSKWGYENIHHVHHQYTAPISYASPYAHWAEVLILGVPTFIGPYFIPGHIITYWLWIASRQIQAIETHCGYDFPWSPAKFIPFYGGSEHHDYHHFVGGQSQSNFASMFTYCDYIYGTDKGYRYYKSVLRKEEK